MKKFGPSEEKEFSPIDKPNIHFHDFVTIKFESFVKPKTVTLYETYNPGAVIR